MGYIRLVNIVELVFFCITTKSIVKLNQETQTSDIERIHHEFVEYFILTFLTTEHRKTPFVVYLLGGPY